MKEPVCPGCAPAAARAVVDYSRSAQPPDRKAWLALAILVAVSLSVFATLSMLPPSGEAPPLDDRPAHLAEAYAALEEVGLALEAHRRREGEYPDRLDDLVPTDLERLPTDPFSPDNAPLRYGGPKPRGEGRVVYSLGPDRVDQGGAPRDPITGRGDLPLPVF